jgi:hypothetical protein
MPTRALRFSLLPGRFAICRLEPNAPVPAWAAGAALLSVTRANEELSVVCAEDAAPTGTPAGRGFRCLKLLGPFALEETGVLLTFIAPLAAQGIPVFAISTYDTDYVLVPDDRLAAALDALGDAGHQMV